MADTAKGAGDAPAGLPEALAKRQQLVTLSDGSAVVLEEWSWAKLIKLFQLIGDVSNAQTMIDASIRPEDRPKIADLSAADIGKLTDKVVEMNAPAVKNLIALGYRIRTVTEGEAPNTQ